MIRVIARRVLVLSFVTLVCCGFASAGSSGSDSKATSDDPVLRAMQEEMQRSKPLKLEGVASPYYIDYRLVDTDQYTAEAAFGSVRLAVRQRVCMLRIVVRIGNYKQDSYFGAGEGNLEIGPLDGDVVTLRHQLWLGTDKAYKAAAEALTAKQAELKKYNVDQPVDDFTPAPPVQSIEPLARLEVAPEPWLKLLEDASGLYVKDPQVESFNAGLRFAVTNRYFVSSEGAIVRSGNSSYQLHVTGHTQAADGMGLDRSRGYEFRAVKELPPSENFLAQASQLLLTLKQLREAPVTDEEYRGPVLFSGDAAASVIASLVGPNILGRRPQLGQNGRTIGAWATNYKSRVLPDFLSVVDDPTISTIDGNPLFGDYKVDDEGVPASRVAVIEKGQLLNYLLGREPIRDLPVSNGHGRAAANAPPSPALGNLIVQSSDPLPDDQLKKKLIELCKQRDLPYGYLVETLEPHLTPRLLYRSSAKDGHEELVRGAVFGDLDIRALRNSIVAAGKDTTIETHLEPIPHSIASPALLFDELQVKRANTSKQKLPESPPPAVTASK